MMKISHLLNTANVSMLVFRAGEEIVRCEFGGMRLSGSRSSTSNSPKAIEEEEYHTGHWSKRVAWIERCVRCEVDYNDAQYFCTALFPNILEDRQNVGESPSVPVRARCEDS